MATMTLLGGELQAGMYSSGGGLYFHEAEVSNPTMADRAIKTGQLPDLSND